ncbi:hypothetical protein ACFYSJ_09540 [Streptomyces sp. NPDC005248]|uniref:hypothetical protein n=1 Tax=Streptomyces sp. NPDC005248 TaxID=3364709 RepID=UPI003687FA06
MFFYDKEIFRKVGVAAPPTSWAEVEAVAKKIKTAGGPSPWACRSGCGRHGHEGRHGRAGGSYSRGRPGGRRCR